MEPDGAIQTRLTISMPSSSHQRLLCCNNMFLLQSTPASFHQCLYLSISVRLFSISVSRLSKTASSMSSFFSSTSSFSFYQSLFLIGNVLYTPCLFFPEKSFPFHLRLRHRLTFNDTV